MHYTMLHATEAVSMQIAMYYRTTCTARISLLQYISR